MKSFAFILNPITIKQLKDYWPAMKIIPDGLIRAFLPSYKVLRIKKIKSRQGNEIAGFLIVCPVLGLAAGIEESTILDKIISAGHLAEGLGAKVLGINGYAAKMADKECNMLARNLKILVTSGKAFTAWSVFEAIYRVAKIKNVALDKSMLVVIGATDGIGILCARKLAECVNSLILVAKDKDKLERLKGTILQQNPIQVSLEEDARRAVKNADIIINAGDSREFTYSLSELKPGTIICNISSDITPDKTKLPNNITLIKAGLIKLPFPVKLGINLGLPDGIVLASMAEAMLLTFKNGAINHALGETINPDKLEEIADLAAQHGFEVWVPEAPIL